MPRRTERWLVLLVALFAFGIPGVAQAAPLGGLVVTPGEGQDATSVRMHTSAGCPASADAYYATLRGRGMPAHGQIVTSTTDAGLSHTGGFDVYLAQTLRDFAADNKTALSGQYDIAVFCIDSFSQESKGEFTAALRFDSPARYAALGAAKGPDRAPDPEPAATSPAPVPASPSASTLTPDLPTPSSAEVKASGQRPSTSDSGALPIVVPLGIAVAVAIAVIAATVARRRGSHKKRHSGGNSHA
jgi:hypothetical protein